MRATPAPSRDDAPEAGRLGKAFGLRDSEAVALDSLLTTALTEAGLNGACVIEGLNKGWSLAQALQLPAGTTQALYARAHQWVLVGRFDRAEMLFHALCLLEPADRNHLTGFAICLKLRGALNDAEASLRRAIRLSPGWGIPYFHLLDIAMRTERWAEADDLLKGFDGRTERDVPVEILTDVARFRRALDMRRQKSVAPPLHERTAR